METDLSAPCEVSVLFPAAGGNMHCFRALTPCAILDVLGPPYSQAQGRHCTYYHDFPLTGIHSRSVLDVHACMHVIILLSLAVFERVVDNHILLLERFTAYIILFQLV